MSKWQFRRSINVMKNTFNTIDCKWITLSNGKEILISVERIPHNGDIILKSDEPHLKMRYVCLSLEQAIANFTKELEEVQA